jgi:hypothetical protein
MRSQSYVHLTAHLANGQLLNEMARNLKDSHRMDNGLIFLKNLRHTFFKKDLSNEPNFGLIHLAGQYF